jgi:O-methyltransferase
MTKAWLQEVAKSALAHVESLEATYDLARACLERGVPGDFVECGVYAGAQCAVMARAIIDYENAEEWPSGRQVHLFDSFAGLPPAEPRDEEIFAKHGSTPSQECTCSLAQVQANMKRWCIPEKLLAYHPGWFEDTVPKNGIATGISLLRLDGDLYQSTAVCLDHLLPLVSRGGWVIVDDFNLTGCRQAVLERVVPAPIYFRIPNK